MGAVFSAIVKVVSFIIGVVNAVSTKIKAFFDFKWFPVFSKITDIVKKIKAWAGPLLDTIDLVLMIKDFKVSMKSAEHLGDIGTRLERIGHKCAGRVVREFGYLWETIVDVEAHVYGAMTDAIGAIYADIGSISEYIVGGANAKIAQVEKSLGLETGKIEKALGIHIDDVGRKFRRVEGKVESIGHFGDMLVRTFEV